MIKQAAPQEQERLNQLLSIQVETLSIIDQIKKMLKENKELQQKQTQAASLSEEEEENEEEVAEEEEVKADKDEPTEANENEQPTETDETEFGIKSEILPRSKGADDFLAHPKRKILRQASLASMPRGLSMSQLAALSSSRRPPTTDAERRWKKGSDAVNNLMMGRPVYQIEVVKPGEEQTGGEKGKEKENDRGIASDRQRPHARHLRSDSVSSIKSELSFANGSLSTRSMISQRFHMKKK